MAETDALSFQREAALLDTGFLARNVLGFNYDKNEKTGDIIRPGGIRSDGPHRTMTEFLDSDTRRKMMQAPRGSYKTTCLTARAIRAVLKHPDCRVLYGMETYTNALKALDGIRTHFESNERLIELFGDLKSKQWAREGFTVNGRTQHMREPSFSAFGVDKVVVGGHYDLIILDDMVSHLNCNSPEQIEKVRECYKFVYPLLDPGGILIVDGTRYHDEDLYGYIEAEQAELFDTLILDCGMELVESDDGAWTLRGKPRFTHLTESFLLGKLQEMKDPAKFSSQYLNRCLSGTRQLFHRHHFRTAKWEPWMSDLAAYVLTDTATSEKESGCQSVLALVLLDAADRSYLADLRVGHWTPHQLVNNLFELLDRWQSHVFIRGVSMEKIALNRVFRSMIGQQAQQRQQSIRFIEIPRGSGMPSKTQRIESLHGRFSRGDFFVITTADHIGVPRYYQDLGQTRTLWEPDGLTDSSGSVLPDGELVRQLVRFPVYSHNDIADALADIESVDRNGNRYIPPGSQRAWRKASRNRARKHGGVVTTMNINGINRLVDVAPANQSKRSSWKDIAGRVRPRSYGAKR